jgi:nitroreductase
MNVLEAIYTRRSVREFTREPVDDSDVRDLVDAAIQAPNAVNRQGWRFVALSNPTILRGVAQAAKAYALARLDPAAPGSAGLHGHLSNPDFNIFYGAPLLVVIWTAGADEMATQDCCLAAENLMLAAVAKGLGSCWIGFAEAWLATDEGKRQLGIDGAGRPVAPIILGHPARIPPPPGREPTQIRWIR